MRLDSDHFSETITDNTIAMMKMTANVEIEPLFVVFGTSLSKGDSLLLSLFFNRILATLLKKPFSAELLQT